MRPDGCLVHLGRKDLRVKIRGHRIEIGEIEMALLDCDNIKETVVITHKNHRDEQYLVAYIIPSSHPSPSHHFLRTTLLKILPDYMIPSFFIELDELPLTPTGKVNPRALPDPDQIELISEKQFAPPRTHIEKQLIKIWKRVLEIDRIGIYNNFFELGGNSLNGAQIIAQIEEYFEKKLSLESFFLVPTIEQLAYILDQDKWTPPSASLVPIQTTGNKPSFFFVHGGIACLTQVLGKDQPLYWLKAHWGEGTLSKNASIEGIAAQHLDEIYAIQPEGPYFLGGYSLGGLICYEMAIQLQRKGEKAAMLFLLDPASPLNAPKILNPHSLSSKNPLPDSMNGKSIIYDYFSRTKSCVIRYIQGHSLFWNKSILWFFIEKVKHRIKFKIKKLFSLVLKILRRPVPPFLQNLTNSQIYNRARQNYIPDYYLNRAVILLTNNHFKDLSVWKKLIRNDIKMHEMPGKHFEIVKEPYNKIWAENLKINLAKANNAKYKK